MQISGHALHGENLIRTTHLSLSHSQQLHVPHSHVVTGTGFGQVIENLQSHEWNFKLSFSRSGKS